MADKQRIIGDRNTFYVIVCVVTIIITIAICAFIGWNLSNSWTEYQAKQSDIAKLQRQITSAEKEEIASADDIEAAISSTKEQGDAIAALQNAKSTIDGADTEGRTNNSDAIAAYFAEDSKSNARVSWFTQTAGDVDGQWAYETAYNFTSSEIGCLWTYRLNDADHTLLAYAVAKYSVNDKLFSDFSAHITSKAYDEYTVAEMSDSESDTSYLDDMISDVENSVGDEEIVDGMTDESVQNAREWLKSQQ